MTLESRIVAVPVETPADLVYRFASQVERDLRSLKALAGRGAI